MKFTFLSFPMVCTFPINFTIRSLPSQIRKNGSKGVRILDHRYSVDKFDEMERRENVSRFFALLGKGNILLVFGNW